MTSSINSESFLGSGPRRYTVAQIPSLPGYQWLSQASLRHLIFSAQDRLNSKGEVIPGNGLAPAIIRVGRKVLIDLDEFDNWVEGHRVESRVAAECHASASPDLKFVG